MSNTLADKFGDSKGCAWLKIDNKSFSSYPEWTKPIPQESVVLIAQISVFSMEKLRDVLHCYWP